MTKDDSLPALNQQAWDEWVEYRKIIGHPLKPKNYPNTQRGMRRFGSPETQMDVVRQSMEHEWRGLFPLKDRVTVETDFNPTAPW